MQRMIVQHLNQAKISEIVPLDTLENLWATKLTDPPQLFSSQQSADVAGPSVLDVEQGSADLQHDNSRAPALSKKRKHQTSSEQQAKEKRILIFSEVVLPNSSLQTIIQYYRASGVETTPVKIVAAHSSLMQKATLYGSESRRLRLEEQSEDQQVVVMTPPERSRKPLTPRYYEHRFGPSASKQSRSVEEVIQVDDEPGEIIDATGEADGPPLFCVNCLSNEHQAVMCRPPVPLSDAKGTTSLGSWLAPVPWPQTRCAVCGQAGHNYCRLPAEAPADDGLYRFVPVTPKPKLGLMTNRTEQGDANSPIRCS